MASFMAGVLSSLAASLLIALVIRLRRSRVRRLLAELTCRALHLELGVPLGRQDRVGTVLRSYLEDAVDVRFLAGRGNELLTETFARFIVSQRHDDAIAMRVLLPDPSDDKWVSDRQNEMTRFDGAYSREALLRTNIWRVQENLLGYLGSGRFDVRIYRFPHLARLVFVDDILFLTPYSDLLHGPASQVYMYRRGSGVYELCDRLFEKIWIDSPELVAVEHLPRATP